MSAGGCAATGAGLGGGRSLRRAGTWRGATPGAGSRQRDERPDAPTISFVDSQTPACIQLDYQRDDCQVNFNYLYVTADTNQYIISMSVRIDNRVRGYYSGFFQNYMYIPADMNGAGYRCAAGSWDLAATRR